MNNIKELHIFALASHGKGISGGDRIWIELARRWQKKFPVTIHTWNEGREMANRQNLKETKDLRFIIYDLGNFCNWGFVICYLARIGKGIWIGLTTKIENPKGVYLYNSSEFWMDSFPCILLKIRYPSLTWVATWYQTAPNPFKGFSEKARHGSYKIRALFYWLVQLPVKPLIARYADKVIVNNEDEKKRFPNHTTRGNTIVLIGAVPLEDIRKYKPAKRNQKYDAVFQGRFHPQKGVVELIDIWKQVVKEKPDAKLAMIGDGPLRGEVEQKIRKLQLEDNVRLFGFVFDGDKKYKTFTNSKMVLHPAYYDSGGMATAEAMAFGIPAIGFNLKAYDSYYPKGMVKVKNEKEFSRAIISLLQNDTLRNKLGREAKMLIEKSYSWDSRAGEILTAIQR